MPIKVTELRAENIKRVKAVQITPTENGLTVIGGNNNQGKTSVLDAIAWTLGGDRYRPSEPNREGSMIPPRIHIELSNGLIVERSGKNSALKVIDPSGNKGGQQLLNEFVEQLALDLPRFLQSSGKEKAQTLLQIIGVGDQLFALEQQETKVYNERTMVGRISEQKTAYAKELPFWPDVPSEPVSASDLIRQQQDILARNGENQHKRDNAYHLQAQRNALAEKVNSLRDELERYTKQLEQAEHDMTIAFKTSEDLQDESTAELEENIRSIDTLNVKIRSNLDRDKAEEDAKAYDDQYKGLTAQLEAVRKAKADLLNGADLPLPGLSVADGELTYNGQKWDNMSSSEQLRVATAIVRRLKPECGFVLLDKLEQMDLNTLRDFGAWLESEGLQAIATRVSTGDECSIIIEDGTAVEPVAETPQKAWKEGQF